MRFSFVGELSFNTKDDAKVPAIKKIGDTGIGINATIVANTNRAYVESVGWQNKVIKTKDTENNNIEIDWDDRQDEDVIKQVAYYRKNIFSMDDDREEFISSYDFCNFIKENIEALNGKRCLVTGQTQENFWKGKESKRFQISNLYIIDKDDERKDRLEMNSIIYWTKDSIDTADFKDEKKIYINGYTKEYLSARDTGEDEGGNRYIPIQLVFDCSKVDFENEKHVARVNYNLMNLGLAYKNGKIVNNLKSNKYYSNDATIVYYNGAKDMGDASEITYDMLTDIQKMKVDVGLAKPEDFATKGRVFGDRIVEYRIVNFPNTGDYADGMVTLEDTASEFEELIFVPSEADDELPFKDDDDDDDIDMPKPKKAKKDDEEDEKPKKKTKAKADPEPEEDEEDDDDDINVDDIFG